MKKIYRFIAAILVSIFLTNALLSNVVLADNQNAKDPLLSQTNTDHNKIQTPEDVNKYSQTGDAEGATNKERPINDVNNGKTTVTVSQVHDRNTGLQSEQPSFIAVAIGSVIKLFPRLFQIVMSQCVGENAANGNLFTIQNLLMGKYDLFDINIFSTSTNVIQGQEESSFNKVIKESVAKWYGTIRNIAIMISLIVLIYTAIRMAMSTTVADRAKYKKMLASWFVGFALIFVLHYIALIMITVSEQLVRMLTSLAPNYISDTNGMSQALNNLTPIDKQPFEYAVLNRIENARGTGWNYLLQTILYAMLVWYQAKFFFMYIKRVISNAFLILISPLVTVTYAIDKSNDCKAQAFNSWFEEMITNVFIQPMHLLLFLVLLYSAGEIAQLYPIVAILFLFGIGKAEKIFRSLFKLRGASIENVEDGTSFTGLIAKI